MNQAISSQGMQSVASSYLIDVVIPAAGVGKRMGSDRPKQYLEVNGSTILAHTVSRMCQLSYVRDVILVIGSHDEYFQSLKHLAPFNRHNVRTVIGGKERADSVLAGIQSISADPMANNKAWVLVHDGARPNIAVDDVNRLVFDCLTSNTGGILASRVKDTMKQSTPMNTVTNHGAVIERTVSRLNLWHALTPQFFPVQQLQSALTQGLANKALITDEASAIENSGQPVLLVEGRSDNIKVTQPEDLALIRFYLQSS